VVLLESRDNAIEPNGIHEERVAGKIKNLASDLLWVLAVGLFDVLLFALIDWFLYLRSIRFSELWEQTPGQSESVYAFAEIVGLVLQILLVIFLDFSKTKTLSIVRTVLAGLSILVVFFSSLPTIACLPGYFDNGPMHGWTAIGFSLSFPWAVSSLSWLLVSLFHPHVKRSLKGKE
jgi:hypothetical protein